MLLLETFSRLRNSNTSLLFWNLFTGLKFLNELNTILSLSQNSQYHSAFVSIWPCIYSASSRSQHTLFTLCHSHQTIIITQSHSSILLSASPVLQNQLPTSLRIPYPNHSFPSQRPSCRFNLLHSAITFHNFFTVSLWAQNLPFQKILSSTLVCFCLSDWFHGSRPFTGLICSSVYVLVLFFQF